MDFFLKIFRFLFGHIDYVIYSLMEWVTQGIFDIAALRTDVSLVGVVRNRIYVFLGIVMFFRLTISLINYVINPDELASDNSKGKSKGLGSIITRTVTMLALLMLLDPLFQGLNRAQEVFLPVLPRIILNTENETFTQDTVSQQAAENANGMAVILMQAFYRPVYDAEDDYVQVGGVPEITNLEEFKSTLTDKHGGIAGTGIAGEFKYEYSFIISTIVGVLTLFLLVSITVDIAARVFKMIILEMIAPVPVISYIDPKSAQEGAFANWVKQVISTFFELFLKLGLVYLILFFIRELKDNSLFRNYGAAEGVGVNPLRLLYLKVFLILGLLKFAKDAPEFIKSIFGIKEKSGEGLGKSIAGVTGFITGGATGAVGGLVSGRGISGALTGAASGAAAGHASGKTGKPVSAYKAGADAAYASRMGDANAKSGLMANLQRGTQKHQAKHAAGKIGVNERTIEIAKKDMLVKQDVAQRHEFEYREVMSSTTVSDTVKRTKYDQWKTSEAEAAKSEKNYTKAKDIAKAYGIGDSDAEKIRKKMSPTTERKDAIKTGIEDSYDKVASKIGTDTIEDKRQTRIDKIADKGGFNPDNR